MVRITYWKEKKIFLLHIRDYIKTSNGFHTAQSKGIALTFEVWKILFEKRGPNKYRYG